MQALREAQLQLVVAEKAVAAARQHRLQQIQTARRRGMSWRGIGAALGLSGPRVHQIAAETEKAVAGRSTRYNVAVRPQILVAIAEALAAEERGLTVDELRGAVSRALNRDVTPRAVTGALRQLEQEAVVVSQPDGLHWVLGTFVHGGRAAW